VWVAVGGMDKVVQLDPSSGQVKQTITNGFEYPRSVAVGPQGNLYIGDHYNNSRIFIYTADIPGTSITTGPSGMTKVIKPAFGFTATVAGSTFECRVDAGAWITCASGTTTPTLADGPHTFEVRGVGAEGADATPASRTFTVDTVLPQTKITSGPDGVTGSASPTFTYASPDNDVDHFECKLDSAPFTTCAAAGQSYTNLSDGEHLFFVRAVDEAGNTDQSPEVVVFTIDLTAPVTTIDVGPLGPTNEPSPTFAYTTGDEDVDRFECKLDDGAWDACAGGVKTFTGVSDGGHTFYVRGVDIAGNVETPAASRTFTVDTTAPSTTIESGPSGITADPSPKFEYTATGGDVARYECRLDGGEWVPCAADGMAFAELDNGTYTFSVRAIDVLGNVESSPASVTFEVQRKPAVVSAPVASGTPKVGQTVQVDTGTWTEAPTSIKVQWLRCNADGADCVAIGGATETSHKMTQDDLGAVLKVRVTAVNRGGETTTEAISPARSLRLPLRLRRPLRLRPAPPGPVTPAPATPVPRSAAMVAARPTPGTVTPPVATTRPTPRARRRARARCAWSASSRAGAAAPPWCGSAPRMRAGSA
jgi:hypothetical protein